MRVVTDDILDETSLAEDCSRDISPVGVRETGRSCLGRHLSEIDPLILTGQIPDAFEDFIGALPSDLQLRRAGFIIAHQGKATTDFSLSLIAIGDSDAVCAGLGIAIPPENSTLHEICDSHCLKTITPAEDFHGNFVERHALIVSARGCFGMYPLEMDRLLLGVVTLNCDNQTTFDNSSEQFQFALGNLAVEVGRILSTITSVP